MTMSAAECWWERQYDRLKAENADLKAENAKLQELCKAWHKFSYLLFDDCIGEPEMDDDFMELDDRTRALGVEP